MRESALVLGNGVSRRTLDLGKLKSQYVCYGCNALYRQFVPDYLVAVDTSMIVELSKSEFSKSNSVWAYQRTDNAGYPFLKYIEPNLGWSSGPTALMLAAQHQHKKIYIAGFDYQGTGDGNSLVNNVYAGTENYKRSDDRATYYGNWLKQTVSVIQKNPDIQFFRVIEHGGFVPDELLSLGNITHINYEIFKNHQLEYI